MQIALLASNLQPGWQLAMSMAFSALLTNFVSNSAAAAVGTPVAVAAAASLAQPVEPYGVAVLFGANLSFATPMAYQTNLLVMNAAGCWRAATAFERRQRGFSPATVVRYISRRNPS